MSFTVRNPALEAFVEALPPELVFGQVLIRTNDPNSFVLTHVEDRDAFPLRDVNVVDLRGVAQFTAEKQFRPLKSAPTLQRGWRFAAGDATALEAGLHAIYPGAVADWFAARQPEPPVTSYRAFTSRQSGMYRITTHLNDLRAAEVALAGCAGRFCLKQRLWTVTGLPADSIEAKSLIPCLEPCAVLLEFARTVARQDAQPVARGEMRIPAVPPAEGLQQPAAVREADFSVASNPRRLQLVTNKLKPIIENENA